MRLASEVLFPGLGVLRLSFGLLDDSLECVNSLTHHSVQLQFDGVKVEVDILAEADAEREWLLNSVLEVGISVKLCIIN